MTIPPEQKSNKNPNKIGGSASGSVTAVAWASLFLKFKGVKKQSKKIQSPNDMPRSMTTYWVLCVHV